jgi:photosystem II stability/assembly factor-like uncharacterized protein
MILFLRKFVTLGPLASRKSWALAAAAVLVMVIYGQQASVADRFALTWLDGRCAGCKVARGIDQIQFTSSSEAWAIGCNFGPEGTGDYIVIRTRDSGSTWTEVSQTYQYAGAPSLSFVNARTGWIAWWNPASEPHLIRTMDGGGHWENVSGRFVQKVRFLDAEHGYGAETTTFLRTDDGGRGWGQVQIPHVRLIDQMLFLSSEVGWVAGTDDKDILVFRTTDGGRSWQESRTASPESIGNIADLYFLDQERGWLIAWHVNNGGTRLFKTVDSGKTWTPEENPSLQGPGKWARVVRFVSDKLGFVFETSEPTSGARRSRSILAYTDDGGVHWHERDLPRTVYYCQVYGGDLRCSADAGNKPGFAVLTVHPK